MNKEIEIPEGYEARIEGNKVILEKKENEDERIRKDLITFICQFAPEHLKVQYVAYLERQKEQKPDCKYGCGLTDEQLMATDFWKEYLKESIIPGNKPTKADIDFLLPIARKYFSLVMKEACTICKEWSNGYQKGLEAAEQKPAEWSEADKLHLNNAILVAKKEWGVNSYTARWLESLRDNYKKCNCRWKPSEEQIDALERAIVKMHTVDDIGILAELRDNLKKL